MNKKILVTVILLNLITVFNSTLISMEEQQQEQKNQTQLFLKAVEQGDLANIRQYFASGLVRLDDKIPFGSGDRTLTPVDLLFTYFRLNKNTPAEISPESFKELLADLVKHGWNVNAPLTENNQTPLTLAIASGNMDLFSFLLDLGADPRSESDGKTLSWVKSREQDAALSQAGPLSRFFARIPRGLSWSDILASKGIIL